MKIMTVFGTRPEAIKVAPLIKAFEADPFFSHITCVTAQHRSLLDQVLDTFEITPKYDLDLMKTNQQLASLSAEMLLQLTPILQTEKPDFILVQGDTTTAMVAGLAAFYQGIKVAHLEAGLRTGNILSPWPEEANRRLVSVLAHIHFAPTMFAQNNLLAEKIDPKSILVTGNSVIDALFLTQQKMNLSPNLQRAFLEKYPFLNIPSRKIMVTLHRRESHGEPIEDICRALHAFAQENPQIDIIFCLHPNPNAQSQVKKILSNLLNVHLIEPPNYPDFIQMMTKTYLILSDSGGIQEEAPSLNIPVLVARDTTERPEGVIAGSSILVGRNGELIKKTLEAFLNDEVLYQKHANIPNPFGDGTTTDQILMHFKSLG